MPPFNLSLILVIGAMLFILFMELPLYPFKRAHIPVAVCLGACVYVLLLTSDVDDFDTFRRIHANWTPWILLVGALNGLALLAPRLITTVRVLVAEVGPISRISRSTYQRISFSFCLYMLSFAGSVLLAWMAVDHWAF